MLSTHFSCLEFTCTCGICAEQCISGALIAALERIRTKLGLSIKITSGFRCAAKQATLRGSLPSGHTAVGRSSHEDGIAADITSADLGRLRDLCEAEFKAIGIAHTFLHVDMRVDKVRRWDYA